MKQHIHDLETTIAAGWVVAVLTIVVAAGTTAQWVRSPGTNTPVSTASGNQLRPSIAPDGTGGAIVAWIDARFQPGWHRTDGWIAAQRLSADGTREWEENGRIIDSTKLYSSISSLIPDGIGGAFLCGIQKDTGSVILHRITGAGTLPWGMTGRVLGKGTSCKLAADGSGGVVVAWEGNDSVCIQRVAPDGSSYWASPGLFLFRGDLCNLCADDAGGSVIIVRDSASSTILAQKVTVEGSVSWGIGGVVVGTGLNPSGVASPEGGCVVAWSQRSGDQDVLFGQAIHSSGILQWGAAGIQLCPGKQPVLVKGLDGEVIVVGSKSSRNICAQCVDASGTLRWNTDDFPIGPGIIESQWGFPLAISDGRGGAILACTIREYGSSYSYTMYAQHIDRAGAIQWSAGGIPVSTDPFPLQRRAFPAAFCDKDNGITIVWGDCRNDGEYYGFPGTNSDIYAQRIRGNGRLGIADIPPAITSVLPAQGGVGTKVTIRGSHFSPAFSENIVRFGGARAEIARASDSLIQVYAPVGAMYATPTVTFGGLTGTGSTPFLSPSPGLRAFEGSMFDSSFSLENGGLPWSLDAADLNNDGKQDLVIAISDRSVVAVRLNTGTMVAGQPISFASAVELPSHPNPTGVSTADIDGDGLLDILVACEGDNTVCLFENTSSGDTLRFAPAISFPVGSKPKGAIAADLDGDGRPEVVTPNGEGQTISILHNRGDLWGITDTSFETAIDVPVGPGPVSAVARDLDGDTRPDIAVACDGLRSVVVLRNTSFPGQIAFAPPAAFGCGGAPGRMAAGDVDADGLLDIVVPLTDQSSVAVLRNSSHMGAVSFQSAIAYGTDTGAWCAAVADLNGDAHIDLAVANYSAGTISLLEYMVIPGGPGDWTYAPAVAMPIAGSPLHLQVSDFNGDGLPDIVCADRTGERACILRGLESPRSPLRITSFSPLSAQAGDIVTIVGTGFSPRMTDNRVRIGAMPVEILSSEPTRITVQVDARTSTDTIRVTSLGRVALSRRALTMRFPTAAMLDSTAFRNPSAFHVGTLVLKHDFHDCDGDGRPELLIVPPSSPTSTPYYSMASLYRNRSGDREISFEQIQFTSFNLIAMASPGPLGWNDVDGDGKDDLMVCPDRHRTSFKQNTSTPGVPSFMIQKFIAEQPGSWTECSRFFDDFNGDGKVDMLVSAKDYTTGLPVAAFHKNSSIQGWISSDSFVLQYIPGFDIKPEWVTDLDGDGLPDLIAPRSDSVSSPIVYRNTSSAGALSFSSPLVLPVSTTPSFIDLDGDDLQDMVVVTTTGVSVYRNTSQGGTISCASPALIPSGGRARFGDLSGDGLADAMIVTGTLAHVYVNTSSIGAISFTLSGVVHCDSTIQGITDMNGDGKSDLVVHRARDSSIAIIPSTFGISPEPFGPEIRIHCVYPEFGGLLDIDGDGVMDFWVGRSYPYEWAFYRNRIGDSYTLRASSDSLGNISPAGDVHVPHGGSQVFLLTPNPGCVLDSVLVDGVRVDSTASYTFSRVVSDHTISARFTSTTDAEEQTLPTEFRLLQNFPNPFNPTTVVSCQVPVTSRVRLVVYDVLGRQVRVLMEEVKPPGTYKITWDAKGMGSGVYFYRMEAGSFKETKRLLLVK